MPYQINEKLRRLTPYAPVQESAGVIHLDANESFLNLPPLLLQKATEAVRHTAFHRYPDPYAAALCTAFGNFYGVNPKRVTAGNGSDELISLLLSCFLMKGETVVTTAPDFSMYTFYPKLSETNCVEVCKGESFALTDTALLEAVQRTNARMLLFSNPCNPTSLGLSREQVLHVVENVDALVVVDEAYMDFWSPEQSVVQEADRYSNLIVLKTCSKMGLAALRLGFAVANEALTGLLHAAKSPYNVNSLSQTIGTLVFQEEKTLREHIQKAKTSRMELQSGTADLLKRFPGAFRLYESCANFITLRFTKAEEAHAYLYDHHISVRQFPGFLRVTAGNPTENEAFLKAMEAFLQEETHRA